MQPDEPNEEERLEELPEDNQTPFNPAAPPRDDTAEPDSTQQPDSSDNSTHPATDTGIQPEEVYEKGLDEAAEIEEPNAGSAVTDYHEPETPENLS